MDIEIEDPLAERTRLREALFALADVAPELGVGPARSASWRSAGAALGDPVLVMLAGGFGSGKTLLAAALGGVSLDLPKGGDDDVEMDSPLTLWKYSFESADIVDGDVVERYRPSPALRDCGYVEVAPAAFETGGELAERAYTMADLLLLVFSADDPWGKTGWEFLRGIHKRRERPTAAVVTHAEGRTAEELDAIVDYLQKTSRAAIAEQVQVFVVSSAATLSGAIASGEGFAELSEWIVGESSELPAARVRLERGENVLLTAAETVSGALRSTVDDTDAEADCVLWMDGELSRERGAASAEAAAAMAPAREIYQDLSSADRRRLSRALGPAGIPGSVLRGGGWIRKTQKAASDAAARRAEEGARRAVTGAGERLKDLGRRVTERVAGVFGEEIAETVPPVPQLDGAEEIGRRAAARVREAAGDREAGVAVAAMLGSRRMMLLGFGLLLIALLAGAFYLFKQGQGGAAALCVGAVVMLGLWSGVLLRSRKHTILAHFDRETSTARDAMGRDLGRVYGPEIDKAFDAYSTSLAPLRARAGDLAADRAGLRARVLDAIEHAAERRAKSVL